MNLLIDAHVFDEPYQGTRTYIKGLYSSLIPMAPQINFYFIASDLNVLKNEFGTSYKNVFFLKFSSKNSYYRLIFEFPKIIKRHKIDYAHFQYISPLIKTCKEIVTVHDLLFLDFPLYFPSLYRFKKNILFKRSSRRADLLLTVSKYSKNRIAKHYKIEEKKIHIIPNGIDKQIFEANSKNDLPAVQDQYGLADYILYVSRIEPRKNHLSLLKSFVELRLFEKGFSLVFIGKEDIKVRELDNYINSLDNRIKSSIRFYSNININELLSFLKNASLFVYPSYAEGFGIPPLEAAALNVKTLCSNKTAMGDFAFFKKKYFDPHNISELKKKISITLKNNKEDLVEISHYIKSKYNWDTIAFSYLELLHKL